MSAIHDWDAAITAPGFREAVLAYAITEQLAEAEDGLPEDEDEVKSMAAEAIESGVTEFSLEDDEGERGSTDVRVFAGLYWMCDWGGISGPFDSLDEAADAVLSMAVDQDSVGFYSAAAGSVPDDFIASRCAPLVKIGKTFVINDTVYIRTKAGLVPQ